VELEFQATLLALLCLELAVVAAVAALLALVVMVVGVMVALRHQPLELQILVVVAVEFAL
jgi:hypothetical protein